MRACTQGACVPGVNGLLKGGRPPLRAYAVGIFDFLVLTHWAAKRGAVTCFAGFRHGTLASRPHSQSGAPRLKIINSLKIIRSSKNRYIRLLL
jgi:hypothetical protein